MVAHAPRIELVVPRQGPLEVYQNGNVIIRLHWRVGEVRFPDAQWDDFHCILGWWCNDLYQVLKSRRRRELMFMDGPYFVGVAPRGKFDCDLTFCRRGTTRVEILASDRMKTADLATSVRNATEKCLRKCARENIEGGDTSAVNSALSKLKKVMP